MKHPLRSIALNRCLRASLICILIIGCKESTNLPDPLKAGWRGHAVCDILEENDDMRVLKCTFGPGVGHERHYHNAHMAYALKGSRFKITDAEGIREADFFTGSYYYSEGVEWHEALNIGDSTAVILIVEPKN